MVLLRDRKDGQFIATIIGGCGLACGMLILGPRLMETVGKNIIKLDY